MHIETVSCPPGGHVEKKTVPDGFLAKMRQLTVDTLDHYEVPIFGRLANHFVDDE